MGVAVLRVLGVLSLALAPLFAAPAVVAADASRAGDTTNSGYLLMDGKGRAVTHTSFPGRFQLLGFGYSASPDTGPTTLAEMAEVMLNLGERAAQVQPVFISVDPARDMPSKLHRFVSAFDTRIIGLSGTEALTARVVKNYKLRVNIVRAADTAPDDYTVDHSTAMILLDPGGNFLQTFPAGTPVADIAATLATLVEQTPPGAH